jgi:spermidine synthase
MAYSHDPRSHSVRQTTDNSRPAESVHNLEWSLFWVSVLGLFLELMMIRWVSTEIRIFAYLQNTVLVVCFLGLGMGCLTARKPFGLAGFLWSVALLVVMLAMPLTRNGLGSITFLLGSLSDLTIWQQQAAVSFAGMVGQVLLGLLLSFILMALLWSMFVPLGRALGRWMNQHPKVIRAYTINVLGSLVGILLFVAMSVAELSPWSWCLVVGLLYVTLVGGFFKLRAIEWSLIIATAAFGWIAGHDPLALETRWSPYQKLTLREVNGDLGEEMKFRQIGKYLVNVNNAGYQGMIDLSPANVSSHPEFFEPKMAGFSQYDIPYLVHPHPRKALIVGAGSGNDVAGGLRNDVQQIVAVEIDPVILSMGQRYHPEQPYASPRVTIVKDDARSFMATCREKFDVVLFGLLDSHTTSAMTNARLDHYVYTKESLAQVRSLLADNGVLALSFEVQKSFIGDRIHKVLTEVFQQAPLEFTIPQTSYGWGGRMFLTGDQTAIRSQLEKSPDLAHLIAAWNSSPNGMTAASQPPQLQPIRHNPDVEVATDDWPYIYLESRGIPSLYFLLAGMLVALALAGLWRLDALHLAARWQKSQWHFFFLGAAFMLLEVQNISKACVVLGSTWWVNAVIIGAILTMVLAANFLVARFPSISTNWAYTALAASCLALYGLDIARFAFLPFLSKVFVVGLLTCLPMLFSGIVFIRSFAQVRDKDLALGANLFGSLTGGILQSVTFLTGTKALLLLVAGLYALAWLCRQSSAKPTPTDIGAAEMNQTPELVQS